MTFISIGNAGASIIVAIMRKFVLLLPLIYLLPHLVKNQTMGVYLAEPAADVIAVSFTLVLFFFQFKKAIAVIEKPAIAGRAFFLLLLPEVLKCGGNFAMMK